MTLTPNAITTAIIMEKAMNAGIITEKATIADTTTEAVTSADTTAAKASTADIRKAMRAAAAITESNGVPTRQGSSAPRIRRTLGQILPPQPFKKALLSTGQKSFLLSLTKACCIMNQAYDMCFLGGAE